MKLLHKLLCYFTLIHELGHSISAYIISLRIDNAEKPIIIIGDYDNFNFTHNTRFLGFKIYYCPFYKTKLKGITLSPYFNKFRTTEIRICAMSGCIMELLVSFSYAILAYVSTLLMMLQLASYYLKIFCIIISSISCFILCLFAIFHLLFALYTILSDSDDKKNWKSPSQFDFDNVYNKYKMVQRYISKRNITK